MNVICAPYHCLWNWGNPIVDLYGYHDITSKSVEFFGVWYAYIRSIYPDWHVYLVDCCGPIPFSAAERFVKEPIEFLDSSQPYHLNPEYKFHVRKFSKGMKNPYGASRTSVDYIKFCLFNKTDLFIIETDCLLSYDITKELTEKVLLHESYCRTNPAVIPEGCILYIYHRYLQEASVNIKKWTEADPDQTPDFREGEFKRLFYDKYGYQTMSRGIGDGFVHKPDLASTLLFIKNRPIIHENINIFLNSIKK